MNTVSATGDDAVAIFGGSGATGQADFLLAETLRPQHIGQAVFIRN